MNKSYKCLILLGAATLAMSTSMLPEKGQISKIMGKEKQEYNYSANMLDNIFIENNDIILPFIFENAQKTISADTIKAEFKKAGLTVKEISTGTKIGTGTKITVEENSQTYNVLIYGDVNNDGKVNLIDAQKIVLHKKYPESKRLTGMSFKAANVSNKDNVVNLIDAQRVVMFKKGGLERKLVAVEPTSLKETDNVKPVITLNGEKTVTVQVGGTYTEAGAKASDNYDGDITSKIVKTGTVNTRKVGSYTIKYNVTDTCGNKADEVTRTVKVVDTTKPVITLNGEKTVTVQVGGTYTEAGAKASDNYDGDITSKIVKTGTVNTEKVGSYTVKYNVTDANGNKANEVSRTVQVVDTTKPVITVNNTNIYTMEVGGTKPTFKATATDNYDTTVQVVITDDIVTNRIGKYTVTFKATDSSNNTATVTKEFEVTDTIASIEMASEPTVQEYEYGVTKLDLSGAKIKINYASNKTETIEVTEEMIVKNYDLTVAGSKTIMVEYKGKQTQFTINVRGKINALEMTEDGKEDTEVVAGGYKVTSKQNFILGTIMAAQQDNVSELKDTQLKIETVSVEENDNGATINDLTVNASTENGKILLKGKAEKPGTYTVRVSMKDDERVSIDIMIQASSSTQVGSISLEAIEDGKVKFNTVETVKKELTVTNVNGEAIELVADDVVITNSTQGINVTKLDKDGDPIINNEDTTIVKYLEITTELKTEQNVEFTIEVRNSTATQIVNFKTGKESILTNVTFGESEVQLYTEPAEGTKQDSGNIYTIIPINFYNQEGDQMNVVAANINIVEEGDTTPIAEQEARIITPLVNKKIIINDTTSFEMPGQALDIIYFDKDGNIVNKGATNTNIAKIGISIILTDTQQKVILSDLIGKKVQVTSKNQARVSELTVKASYKDVTTAKLNSSNVTLPEKTAEGYYKIGLNEKVTFGKIEVGDYERPLTPDMLRAELTAGTEGKVNVSFEYEDETNQTGAILLKVEATSAVISEIIPYVGDIEVDLDESIIIKAEGVPTITSFEITNKNVEIGRATQTTIKAVSAANPNGETIKLKDIDIPEVEGLTINALDKDGDLIAKGHSEEEVCFLEFATDTITTDTNKDIEFTVFGKKYTQTIQIYQPIPRAITIAQTVRLTDTETADTKTVDGTVYALVDIQVFADEAKTKPITLTEAMLQDSDETAAETIYVKIPQEETHIDGIPDAINQELVELKYFDKDKNETTTGIAYIGIAIKSLTGFTYDQSLLDGMEISLKCVDTAEVYKITTQYTNN